MKLIPVFAVSSISECSCGTSEIRTRFHAPNYSTARYFPLCPLRISFGYSHPHCQQCNYFRFNRLPPLCLVELSRPVVDGSIRYSYSGELRCRSPCCYTRSDFKSVPRAAWVNSPWPSVFIHLCTDIIPHGTLDIIESQENLRATDYALVICSSQTALLRCTLQCLTTTDTFHLADGSSASPWLHLSSSRHTPETYPDRYSVVCSWLF